MSKFTLRILGESRTFVASRQGDRLLLDDGQQTAVLHLTTVQDHYLLEWEQPDGTRRPIHLAGHKTGNLRQLWVNGRYVQVERPRKDGRDLAATGAGDALAATIPAVVTDLLVKIGETVSIGQKLILLESMKMVIPIQAPYAGTIKAIHCQPGDSVHAGFTLIDIHPQ